MRIRKLLITKSKTVTQRVIVNYMLTTNSCTNYFLFKPILITQTSYINSPNYDFNNFLPNLIQLFINCLNQPKYFDLLSIRVMQTSKHCGNRKHTPDLSYYKTKCKKNLNSFEDKQFLVVARLKSLILKLTNQIERMF